MQDWSKYIEMPLIPNGLLKMSLKTENRALTEADGKTFKLMTEKQEQLFLEKVKVIFKLFWRCNYIMFVIPKKFDYEPYYYHHPQHQKFQQNPLTPHHPPPSSLYPTLSYHQLHHLLHQLHPPIQPPLLPSHQPPSS